MFASTDLLCNMSRDPQTLHVCSALNSKFKLLFNTILSRRSRALSAGLARPPGSCRGKSARWSASRQRPGILNDPEQIVFYCFKTKQNKKTIGTICQMWKGSFSAVSKPIFASECAFCSIFQVHFCTAPNSTFSQQINLKISDFGEIATHFLYFSAKPARFARFRNVS